MTQIIGNRWNALTKFLFAYELYVMFPHEPDDWWDVVHALVIGYYNKWPVLWDIVRILERIGSPQEMRGTH